MVDDDKPAATDRTMSLPDANAETAVAATQAAPARRDIAATEADPNGATAVATRKSRMSMSRILSFSPGDVVANRYKIRKMLGHGGMGDVYEATDVELRTDIALKTVRGTSNVARTERFRREIFLARKVTHPNVCRVFDIGRHTRNGEEILFITMELLRGVSLADKLKAVNKVGTGEALGLIKQIASAIEAAHDAGIVHRDLKPGNVMLVPADDAGKVIAKVTDFGVAHAAGDPFEDVSGTGDIVGSPAYMAPEQVEGLEPSPRADIYALGIMMYEMVTGVRPFHGESSLSSAVKRLKVDAEPPSEYLPDISPIWEAAIMRCLQREPSARFQTVGDIVHALTGGPTARVQKFDLAEITEPVAPLKTPRKKRMQGRVLALGGVTVAIAALALAFGPLAGRGRVATGSAAGSAIAGSGAAGSGSAAPPPAANAPAPKTTIAVLPFTIRGPSTEQDYLADGLTDELLVLVGKLPGVTVIGRTSAFAMKNTQDDAATIGKRLGVRNLLEGSIAKVGDRVRITARLLDTSNGTQLWSESYDRATSDLFAMQDEIAAAVARALAVELSPLPTAPGERTANAEAHGLVLRGRALLARDYDQAELEQAAAAFERAVQLDPSYAAALAGLAVSQYWLRDFSSSPAESDRLAKRALELADKARAIGPEVGEVHAVRGFLFFNITWDWAAARAELERALELEPGNRETLRMYGMLLALLGQTDKALDAFKQAVAADPLSARAWSHLASQQTVVGELVEARKSIGKALELNPTSNIAHLELGTLELVDKHPEAALAQAKLMKVEVYSQIMSALAEHSLGHKAASDEHLAALIKTNRHTAAYQIAEIYAWRGELDRAFEWLDNAIGDHDAGLSDVRHDVLLASIRTDPRYRALLTKLGL
jgi:serine/threonine-protein kinase